MSYSSRLIYLICTWIIQFFFSHLFIFRSSTGILINLIKVMRFSKLDTTYTSIFQHRFWFLIFSWFEFNSFVLNDFLDVNSHCVIFKYLPIWNTFMQCFSLPYQWLVIRNVRSFLYAAEWVVFPMLRMPSLHIFVEFSLRSGFPSCCVRGLNVYIF